MIPDITIRWNDREFLLVCIPCSDSRSNRFQGISIFWLFCKGGHSFSAARWCCRTKLTLPFYSPTPILYQCSVKINAKAISSISVLRTPNDTSKTAHIKLVSRHTLYQVVFKNHSSSLLKWTLVRLVYSRPCTWNFSFCNVKIDMESAYGWYWINWLSTLEEKNLYQFIASACTDDYRLAELMFTIADSMSDI
jgi:hypothetical protein